MQPPLRIDRQCTDGALAASQLADRPSPRHVPQHNVPLCIGRGELERARERHAPGPRGVACCGCGAIVRHGWRERCQSKDRRSMHAWAVAERGHRAQIGAIPQPHTMVRPGGDDEG